MKRKGQEGFFAAWIMILVFAAAVIITSGGDITGDAVSDGVQIGEIDKVLTTGNGDTCTVFIDNNTYTVDSYYDCTDASTGFVLYKFRGDYELLSPEEVRSKGGVVPE